MAAYRRAYGADPDNAFAALGYDAVYLLADAIRRAGAADPLAVRRALADTRGFQGVTGEITYPPGTHVPLKSVALIAIQTGAPTLAAELVPARVPPP
jgi:branched-chain amino acid transport system substrate-binding protein